MSPFFPPKINDDFREPALIFAEFPGFSVTKWEEETALAHFWLLLVFWTAGTRRASVVLR
jgi:hypothetical protein